MKEWKEENRYWKKAINIANLQFTTNIDYSLTWMNTTASSTALNFFTFFILETVICFLIAS